MEMAILSMDLEALWLTLISQFMAAMLILMTLNNGRLTALAAQIFSKLQVGQMLNCN
jgi:hypothetical protein